MPDPIVTTNVAQLAEQVLGRLRGLQGQATRATRNTLRAHGDRWRAAMIDRFQPWTPGFRHSADSPIRRRSSALARSMSVQLFGTTLDEMKLVESAGGSEAAPHAPLQEFGGTITPKKGKWLAIPMAAALTGSGVPRRGYESPRDVRELFFLQTPKDRAKDRAWLVRSTTSGVEALHSDGEAMGVTRRRKDSRAPKDAKLEFLYLLIKSATIPPRLGMRDTEHRLAPQRLDDFWNWLRRELATPLGAASGPGPAAGPST